MASNSCCCWRSYQVDFITHTHTHLLCNSVILDDEEIKKLQVHYSKKLDLLKRKPVNLLINTSVTVWLSLIWVFLSKTMFNVLFFQARGCPNLTKARCVSTRLPTWIKLWTSSAARGSNWCLLVQRVRILRRLTIPQMLFAPLCCPLFPFLLINPGGFTFLWLFSPK